MKFLTSIFAISIAGIMTLNAQLKQFTLHDLTPGGKTYLRPKAMKGSAFWGDTFVFQQGDSILSKSASGKTDAKPIVTLEQLNKALEAKGYKSLQGVPSFTYPTNTKSSTVRFHSESKIHFYDLLKQEITRSLAYETADTAFDFNSELSTVALTNGDRLFVILADGTRKEVSDQSIGKIVWGQSVHRNEFGIHKGTFWSPKGDLLAFYRMDETMVSDYPLVDISAREAALKGIKYPMAGMTSHEVTLGIYNLTTGNTVYLNTGEPRDHYLTNITWSPNQQQILIAELNREQNKMDLNLYDVVTGNRVKTLFTEQSDKYVEPEHPAIFLGEKGDRFIWLSERDGYNHIYLYDNNGKELKQLTAGKWMVKDIVKIDTKGEELFFTSTEVSPIEQHLYKLNLKSGKRTRLTNEEGYHSVRLNASNTLFFDSFSSKDVPGKSELVNLTSGKSHTLLTSVNPYEGYAVPDIELGKLKAADGETDLFYRLTKPVDFDPTKKYPTIVYLYNGPHAQLVTNNWLGGIRGWDIYMAQMGYVVFTVDGRGSANRGRDFEQAIHLRLGEQEGKDQIKGVEFLKSLSYVDTERIGISGWSYGGFMTTYMMLTYPDLFKVGVAGGPVIDWKYYEVMYGERYMGHPDRNKEGYEYSNLLNKVGNLQGRLLMIHGDMDPVVVMQHTMAFLKKSVEESVYPDLFIYPGHEHNVHGVDRVHLFEKITRYFEDYLK